MSRGIEIGAPAGTATGRARFRRRSLGLVAQTSGGHPRSVPRDVADLLGRLVGRQARILDERLVGCYLFGSAASGDFEPGISDVDTVAVMTSEPTARDLEELAELHADIVRESPEWEDRIEAIYLSAAALADFRSGRHPAARISPGEAFHAIEVDQRWVLDWCRVRELGVALLGPPAKDVIPEVSLAEFVDAARRELLLWPSQLRLGMSTGSLAYAVLTVCRTLCLYETQAPASKREGASWAA